MGVDYNRADFADKTMLTCLTLVPAIPLETGAIVATNLVRTGTSIITGLTGALIFLW